MANRQSISSVSRLAGDRYNRFRGDCDLDAPMRLPLDDRVIALGRDYASRNAKVRKPVRQSLTEEDIDTLMCFGKRAAALALRSEDPKWLLGGLTACAMIETWRVDPRDIASTPGLIFAVFHELGIDPTAAFAEAAKLAKPGMSQLMLGFQDRPADHRKISAWLHDIVKTPNGPGLIRRDVSQYHPTVPLDLAILQIGQILRADKYAAEVIIATDFPAVWLSEVDDAALTDAIDRVVAGAMVQASVRPSESAEPSWAGMMVFLVETAHELAAKTLLTIANRKRAQLNAFAMTAAQRRQLFCLFVAKSFIVGGQSPETNDTLKRFLPSTEAILGECATAKQPLRDA